MTDLETLDAIWCDAWQPPDRRPPWKWAEDNVEEIPHSPSSGRFRSSASPWLREPLECLANPRIFLISIIAAIQSGKTLFAEIGSAWQLVNAPSPVMILHQKDADAELYNATRLRPFYKKIKAVARLFHPDRHKTKKDSAVYLNGAIQLFKGAWNIKNLQGHTLRTIWGDETWQWPAGHMAEVEARLSAYGFNALAVLYSQAGEVGDDTHEKHEQTDKRKWNFKCVDGCGEFYPFEWSRVEWDRDKAKRPDGTYDFGIVSKTAVYRCECGHAYEDTDRNRKRMSAGGKYVATNPDALPGKVGFHWNQLCCKSWGFLAELYLRAKLAARRGDLEDLKKFYQKRLAISWDDNLESFELEISESSYDPRETWEEEGVMHRKGYVTQRVEEPDRDDFESETAYEEARTAWRDVMKAAKPLRFLTADTQGDHWWLVIRSWSPTGSSRLVHWAGGRKGDKAVLSYDDIEDIAQEWGVPPRFIFIDNGYKTSEVNMECAKRGWVALQGRHRDDGFTHTVAKRDRRGKLRKVKVSRYFSPPVKVEFSKTLKATVIYWSNLHIKDTLGRLRSNQDPAEGATWEVFKEVGKAYLKQLDSEHRVKQASGKMRWEPITEGRDNHLWDCEAEQVVVANMFKLIGKEAIAGDEPEEEPEKEIEK